MAISEQKTIIQHIHDIRMMNHCTSNKMPTSIPYEIFMAYAIKPYACRHTQTKSTDNSMNELNSYLISRDSSNKNLAIHIWLDVCICRVYEHRHRHRHSRSNEFVERATVLFIHYTFYGKRTCSLSFYGIAEQIGL